MAGASADASTTVKATAVAHRACNAAPAGYVSCHALVKVDTVGNDFVSRNVRANVNPAGYHPLDLQKAYKLTPSLGKTGTVAIVDAFDNPTAEADLAVYRKQFGLPPCTTANGCFRKLNQNGAASPLPPTNVGWGEEIALDLDMVSATCPKCKIILVEASSNSFASIVKAVDTASKRAHIVSNSYGGGEFSGSNTLASHYAHPGVVQTVSSGDSGFAAGPQVPAVFKTVTSVGGTALHKAANARGFTESAWRGAGSGCSFAVAKPAFQHDTLCNKRMVSDVSAVADPATGVSVYDTFGVGGWLVFGGTSASAPIIAGVYALAGNAASMSDAAYVYAHAAGHLFDVNSGSNGSCGGTYRCTGKPGYDGPTGLGTPNGVLAF